MAIERHESSQPQPEGQRQPRVHLPPPPKLSVGQRKLVKALVGEGRPPVRKQP